MADEPMTDEEVLAALPEWAQYAYKDSLPELPDGDPGDQTTWTLCRLLAEARRENEQILTRKRELAKGHAQQIIEIAALRREVERLRKALEYYADEKRWGLATGWVRAAFPGYAKAALAPVDSGQ